MSAANRSNSSITTALIAAAGDLDTRPTAVGIWVVWLRDGESIHIESTARLDIEVPVAIILDADEAVLVAAAPLRVAGPVLGRVDLIHQYLMDKGVPTSAVHVPVLADGEVWTMLAGGASGIVPPLRSSQPERITPHRHRLPRPGAAVIAGLLVGVCAAVATLVVAVPALAAPTSVGLGPIIGLHSGELADVTGPPRAVPLACAEAFETVSAPCPAV